MCGCRKQTSQAAQTLAASSTTASVSATTPGMPRFRVVSKTETDENGQPVELARSGSYREASIVASETGGLIRLVK